MRFKTRNILSTLTLLALFALPLFSFTGKNTEHLVPFTLEDGHIIVKVKLNGKSIKALVDTGFEKNLILSAVASKVGISGKPAKAKLKVKTLTVNNSEWLIYDYSILKKVYQSTGVGAILGTPFLNRYTVSFDFAKKEIGLQKPESKPHYPKEAVVLPFEMFRGGIVLQVHLNGKGPFRALIDSGSPHIRVTPNLMQRIGAPNANQIQTIQVGSIKLENVTVSSQSTLAAMMKKANLDMLLGLKFFSRYKSIVDYQNKKVALIEQNK